MHYISLEDLQAAEKYGYALIDASLSLQKLPERGRFVPEFDDGATREIIYGSYRIVYRINLERRIVWVSRFWHAARGTPQV